MSHFHLNIAKFQYLMHFQANLAYFQSNPKSLYIRQGKFTKHMNNSNFISCGSIPQWLPYLRKHLGLRSP